LDAGAVRGLGVLVVEGEHAAADAVDLAFQLGEADRPVGGSDDDANAQPSGIRASDALAWAREIIARYGGEISTGESGDQTSPDSSPTTLRVV